MRRITWILLLVLALLVVFTWLFQRYQGSKSVVSPTATAFPTAVSVYNLTNLQVSGLNVVDNLGSQIGLYRDSSTSNNWAIRDVPADSADTVGIESAISKLLSLKVIDQLTGNPPLESIGLATPVYKITIITMDGKKVITDVGNKTPIGTGYYIRVDSGPILIVDNLTMDSIVNFIKQPPLLTTPTPEVKTTETGTSIAPNNQATPPP